MQNEELLRVSDFFIILLRGKKTFIATWILVIALAVVYLSIASKAYKLTGTIYVGRMQETLLEEGEFVASKLHDYSFVKRALERNGVEVDMPVSRLTRKIKTQVVNEVKKIRDVGIVQITVEFKDPQKTLEIYKAVTDLLIAEHGELLEQGASVFKDMENMFWQDEARLRASLDQDEAVIEKMSLEAATPGIPSFLLLGHTVAEKRASHQRLVKDIHYLKLEADSAVKSYNTRLAAQPVLPDEPFKPKKALTLIIAAILATVAATVMTLAFDFYLKEIRPKL